MQRPQTPHGTHRIWPASLTSQSPPYFLPYTLFTELSTERSETLLARRRVRVMVLTEKELRDRGIRRTREEIEKDARRSPKSS